MPVVCGSFWQRSIIIKFSSSPQTCVRRNRPKCKMSDLLVDLSNLSEDVRAKLAELDLELSEGEFSILLVLCSGRIFFFGKTNI